MTCLSRALAALKFSTAHTALQARGVSVPASASSRRLWDAKLTGSSVQLSSLLWSMPCTQFSFSWLHFSPHPQIPLGLLLLTSPFPSSAPKEQTSLQDKPCPPPGKFNCTSAESEKNEILRSQRQGLYVAVRALPLGQEAPPAAEVCELSPNQSWL